MAPYLLEQLFADTTIEPKSVGRYLTADPGYLRAFLDGQCSPHLRTVANHLDYVSFHVRFYLTGGYRTLHRVFHEIRLFAAYDQLQAERCIPLLLNHLRDELLEHEWYELMPRFKTARRRIRKTFDL